MKPTKQELLEQNEWLHQAIDQAEWSILIASNGQSTAVLSNYPPGSDGINKVDALLGILDALEGVRV